jgi:mycothiol S-conjugate amidase
MVIHAHPDDESSKGSATVARYHDEGVYTILVCCTGGEEGDILNPAANSPGVRENIATIRHDELHDAASIIGYDEVVHLGYRDSGMPDSPANRHPEAFANVSLEAVVSKLVTEIRRTRPQVIITYPDERNHYPHPDHIRVHDASLPAFDAAGDPSLYPDAGKPWQPSRLFYVLFSGGRILEMHEQFLLAGKQSPFDKRWLERAASWTAKKSIIRIDVTGYTHIRRKALLAHATQIDPQSPFWFGLPDDVVDKIAPYDEYELARYVDGTGKIIIVDDHSAEAQGRSNATSGAGIASTVGSASGTGTDAMSETRDTVQDAVGSGSLAAILASVQNDLFG